MKMYFKGYGARIKPLIAVIVICVLSLLIPFALFHGKTENISGQLETYQNTDYEKLYILNYDIPLENECLYADSDLMVFKDNEKKSRLTVSTVMAKQNSSYSLDCLAELNDLGSDEILVSRNVAQKYKIVIGDTLFVEFPYSEELKSIKVKGIIKTDFDYQNPNISNDVGIVFIGNDETYQSAIQCKSIVYASSVLTDRLSQYPQVINSIVEKQNNMQKVFIQGIVAMIFEIVFAMIAIILSRIIFFSKSQKILKRCFFKGASKSTIVTIPLLEKIIFGLIPASIVQAIIFSGLPNSSYALVYCLIPCVLYFLYCVISVCRDVVLVRKR